MRGSIVTLSRWHLLLPYADHIPRHLNGTAEGQSWWWAGRMYVPNMYVGTFLFASVVSSAFPK